MKTATGFRQVPEQNLTAKELRAHRVELKKTVDLIVVARLREIAAEQARTGKKPSNCGLRAEDRETVFALQTEIRDIERRLAQMERR
jgi:hypothetical protein